MKYKTILFDFDGTLADSEQVVLPCARETLLELGYAIPERQRLLKFIGPPLETSFRVCGVPESDLERAVAVYRRRYNSENHFARFSFYPGIKELLTRLKAGGAKIAVSSLRMRSAMESIKQYLPIEKYFDCICGRIPEENIENKADVARRTLEELDAGTTGAVLVGDSSYDEEGAEAVGIDFIAAMYGFGFASGDEARTAFKAYSVAELAEYLL